MKEKTKSQVTLQLISIYDMTHEHYVERVSRYLRDSLSVIYDFMNFRKVPKTRSISLVFGDIIPPSFVFGPKENVRILEYHLFDYPTVEDIIKEVNVEVYGESLVQIPDSDIIYIIKIISDFSN